MYSFAESVIRVCRAYRLSVYPHRWISEYRAVNRWALHVLAVCCTQKKHLPEHCDLVRMTSPENQPRKPSSYITKTYISSKTEIHLPDNNFCPHAVPKPLNSKTLRLQSLIPEPQTLPLKAVKAPHAFRGTEFEETA